MADQTLEDDRLIAAHCAGDKGAFAKLVERYGERVYRLCVRLAKGPVDALDLYQLTFLKAYLGLGGLRAVRGPRESGPSSPLRAGLYTWLYRIATNASLDLRRRSHKERGHMERLAAREGGGDGSRGREAALDPASVALRNELAAVVGRAVDRLRPEHRTPLLLRLGGGLTYRDIAAALACPLGTVLSRVHAARATVRASLAGYLEVEAGLVRDEAEGGAKRGRTWTRVRRNRVRMEKRSRRTR